MQLIEAFNIAFAENDIDFLLHAVTEDIQWLMVGKKAIQGKKDFETALRKMEGVKAKELIIQSVISHGAEGACAGEMIMEDGDSYAFADIYRFNSAAGKQIKFMRSLVIKLN
jgi:limonene-1,2-epoxide hydrolase